LVSVIYWWAFNSQLCKGWRAMICGSGTFCGINTPLWLTIPTSLNLKLERDEYQFLREWVASAHYHLGFIKFTIIIIRLDSLERTRKLLCNPKENERTTSL
jgi:hypothetical protein